MSKLYDSVVEVLEELTKTGKITINFVRDVSFTIELTEIKERDNG